MDTGDDCDVSLGHQFRPFRPLRSGNVVNHDISSAPRQAQTISVQQIISFCDAQEVLDVRQTVDFGQGSAPTVNQTVRAADDINSAGARKRTRRAKAGVCEGQQGHGRGRKRRTSMAGVGSGEAHSPQLSSAPAF